MKIHYSIDDSLHLHLIGLMFDPASPWYEKEKETMARLAEVEGLKRDKFHFLLKSTQETSELVHGFLSKFHSIRLQTVNQNELPKELLEQFIDSIPVIERAVLESYQSPEERYIQTNLQRILWSDHPQRTIHKVIRYYFQLKPSSHPESFVRSLSFHEMLPRGWEADLKKAEVKYAACWENDKKRQSLIVMDAFDYVASLISEDDRFMSSKNQTITPTECQFLLYKLTLWIYTKKRKNGFARSYFAKIAGEYKTTTGKTLNHHKIGHITQILHNHNLITKVIRPHGVSVYDIGSDNPFHEYYRTGCLVA
jgi:hypothetical protein